MDTVHPPQESELLTDVEHAHSHAFAAPDDPAVNSRGAVTWSSAHLAVAGRVLYPVAARVLERGRSRVRDQRAVDHERQYLLWRLDRRLTGDVHRHMAPVEELEDAVRAGPGQHADGGRALVHDLRRAFTPEQQHEVADALATAIVRGPTRPHPHTALAPCPGGSPSG